MPTGITGDQLCSDPVKRKLDNEAEDCKTEVGSPPIPYSYSGVYRPNVIVRDFKRFKMSSNPSRFLFLRDESWAEFDIQVLDVLKAGFVSGKTALEAFVDEELYLFDFLRMLQVDLWTGARNSIAWIDVDGRCFFPREAVDERSYIRISKKLDDGTNDRHIELGSSRFPNSFYGSFLPDDLVKDFRRFKMSGNPSRFLLFQDDLWTNFDHQMIDFLKSGFVLGQTVMEAFVGGDLYLFDFLQMLQIDTWTGFRNSIAWIDVDGRCFFPRAAIDERTNIRITKVYGSLSGKRDLLNPHENKSTERSSNAELDLKTLSGLCILESRHKCYKVVEKLFLTGILRSAPGTIISSISRCVSSSRLKAFEMQMQMMKAARGVANVKYGWFGGLNAMIDGAIAQGFSHPNNEILGSKAVGLHLSPPLFSYTSSLLSEADGNGETRVILCRVIMGKSERVPSDSIQFGPSNDQFDSGVDDLTKPRWYIVWSTHMNTHILPEFVVSFKSSKQFQE